MTASPTPCTIQRTINDQLLPSSADASIFEAPMCSRLGFKIVAAQANVGFAVGTDQLALAEWNDAGEFEFHVPEHFAGQLVGIHVATRGAMSQGKLTSPWLGPVDEMQVFRYRITGVAFNT